jgi:peptidoglycan/xylan/chitin deacetylase (PgdA/CDA1 family)
MAFDRLGRDGGSTLRQAARRLLIALLPERRLTTHTGPHWQPQWTFDDGPDPAHTPPVLDVLAEYGIRAAFFLIGEAASRHPALVRRIVAEGHLVGSHSHSHPARGTLGTAAYMADVDRGRATIEAITGTALPAFRPPHGYLSAGILRHLMRRDWQVVLWSVDPKDYAAAEPAAIVAHLDAARLTPRDIVLLHDTGVSTAAALARHLARATV